MPGGTEKTTKTLRQDIQSLGLHLNSEPPKYEAGVLTIRPQLSVICTYKTYGMVQYKVAQKMTQPV
jgi:hypothetical protein